MYRKRGVKCATKRELAISDFGSIVIYLAKESLKHVNMQTASVNTHHSSRRPCYSSLSTLLSSTKQTRHSTTTATTATTASNNTHNNHNNHNKRRRRRRRIAAAHYVYTTVQPTFDWIDTICSSQQTSKRTVSVSTSSLNRTPWLPIPMPPLAARALKEAPRSMAAQAI